MNIVLLLVLWFQWGPGTPEPIDVSPIAEESGPMGYTYCDMGCSFYPSSEHTTPDPFGQKPHRQTRLTCADKTRFLMTSEDGKQHCIKIYR